MNDTLVTRISKLLAKAENTDSTAEAATFFEAAQRLCTQHSIDMALAHAAKEKSMAPDVIEERSLTIGEAGSDNLKQKVLLWHAIAEPNNLRYSITHDSSTVHPVGYTSDLDMAESLWGVLMEQMVRLCNDYLNAGEWKGTTYTGESKWMRVDGEWVFGPEVKKVNRRVARRSFYEGFIHAVGLRLKKAHDEVVAEHIAADTARDATLPSVTSLVLVDRKAKVDEFTDRAFAARGVRGSWRGSKTSGSSSKAQVAGSRAGASASLSGRKAIA